MKTQQSMKHESAAIAGYYIERVAGRVILSKGQVGAWRTVSRDATKSQVASAGFNLRSPAVQRVIAAK